VLTVSAMALLGPTLSTNTYRRVTCSFYAPTVL
jgi:hypothetical protein